MVYTDMLSAFVSLLTKILYYILEAVRINRLFASTRITANSGIQVEFAYDVVVLGIPLKGNLRVGLSWSDILIKNNYYQILFY